MTAGTITIDVSADLDDGPARVYTSGGVLFFDTETEALGFVARRLADRPNLTVEVRAS